MQTCKYCNIQQELYHFRIRKLNGKDYTSHKCKTCEQVEQKQKTSASWPRYFLRLLGKRKHYLELSIEECLELLKEQNGLCALSGVPLTKIHGKGRVNTNASLDRLQAGGSYKKENVRLVCDIVNRMRLDNTDTELQWWCSRIIDEANN